MAVKVLCDMCGKEIKIGKICYVRIELKGQTREQYNGERTEGELCSECAIKLINYAGINND